MTRSDLEAIRSTLEAPRSEPLAPEVVASRTLSVSKAIRDQGIERAAAEASYSTRDVEALWDEAERFLEALPSLAAFHQHLSQLENESAPRGRWQHERRLLPWGTVLVALPANAIVPLSLILPAALAAAGNRVIVAVSSAARESGLFILEAMAQELGGQLLIWRGETRNAITDLVGATPLIDALYFMGSSRHFAEIAASCAAAGVALLYEGEGRGVAIIDDDLTEKDLRRAARLLVAAKIFCGGCMCSAPNAALIPARAFEAFASIYDETCREWQASSLDLATLSASQLETIEERNVLHGARAPRPDSKKRASPFYWRAGLEAALTAPELFCPGILLAPGDDIDACIRAAAAQRFRLQVSLFTRRPELFDRLLASSGFARYCLQMDPVAQDSLLPWGNYGLSGQSDVLDFYRKGLRRVVIERPRKEAEPT